MPRVLIADELSPAAVAIFRERGVDVDVRTGLKKEQLLEIIGQIGLWPAYEEWKLEMLRVVTTARAQGGHVSLRDFGAYDAFSVEPIPMAGGRGPLPRWYWESGHFKAELAVRMLRIMAGLDPPDDLFGVELTSETIEATLAAIRESRRAFADAQPGSVAEIGEMIVRARSSRVSPSPPAAGSAPAPP